MIVAGGIESMSRVPMGSDGAAWAMDPETAYDTYFVPQGISADLRRRSRPVDADLLELAGDLGELVVAVLVDDLASGLDLLFAGRLGRDVRGDLTREDVDAYAVRSQERAENAWKSGYFSNSVVPVLDRNGVTLLDHDEHMRPGTTMESLGQLAPSFAGIGDM